MNLYTKKNKKIFGWTIDNFLDEKTCEYIIKKAEPLLEESSTLSPKVEGYRTS